MNVDVAIIGAGMSGLFMAKRLGEAGLRFAVYEKAHEVGGTWRENRYPGLFVDVPMSKYQLSFAPKADWGNVFAAGPEIQQYLVDIADSHDLRRHIQFDTTVVSTRWTADGWLVTKGDGTQDTAAALVFATGFLRQPKLPKLDGMDSFAGPSFHSSQWPDGLDVTGKRIGDIVGTGSSGILLVSELAYHDCEVTQFVRTPQWIAVLDNPASSADWRARVRLDPDSAPAAVAEFEKAMNQDPRVSDINWKFEPGPLRDTASQAFRDSLEVIADPVLRAALTPDYPPGCKRIPKSPRYYRAVQEPNVRVVSGGVVRVEERGLVSSDGALHEFDVIVYATGFDAHAYMRPIQVTGVNGTELDDVWSDGPFSYKGIAVPDFPNMFVLHGPFSPVNLVPPPLVLDDQADYLSRLIDMFCRERVAVHPTRAATRRFCDTVEQALGRTVWMQGCDNWYMTRAGVPLVWPWLDAEHTAMFEQLSLEDFDVSPMAPALIDAVLPELARDGSRA